MEEYTEELKWFKSLERVLKKQPDTVAVIVYMGGNITMVEKDVFIKRMRGEDGFEAADLCNLDEIRDFSSSLEPYGESM